jgi:hypothetical protein
MATAVNGLLAALRPSSLNASGLIVDGRRSEADAEGAPSRSSKSIEAAVQVATARRFKLLDQRLSW